MKRIQNYTYYMCCAVLLLTSCSTYRAKSDAFQQKVQAQDYGGAMTAIENNTFLKKKRNQLLYCMEKGKVAYLNGQYEQSNKFFNQANTIIDENKRQIHGQLLGLITNPEQEFYKGEDFEKVAIHYYKALNYTFLKNTDEALVEARKINLQLQNLNDQYSVGEKNKYGNDTFALTLQGLLYESTGDTNNAFIAYRNAVNLYLQNNGDYFGVSIPNQLQEDLLRTAHIMGFDGEVSRYETLLNTTYKHKEQKSAGEAIIFWENGLVPYKDETSFIFSLLHENEFGILSVYNEDLDLSIPLPIPRIQQASNDEIGLDIFRVAFPRYISREALFRKGSVKIKDKEYPFQMAENYENIAIKTLKDRAYREIGKAVLRLAIKKTSEYALKQKDEPLGALLGIFNAISEGADTRNWQSLPGHIHYTRIPIQKGQNTIEVVLEDQYHNVITKTIQVHRSGTMVFAKIATPEVL